jgi:hypothetical protein
MAMTGSLTRYSTTPVAGPVALHGCPPAWLAADDHCAWAHGRSLIGILVGPASYEPP